MVIIHLSNIEAKELSKRLSQIADNIEIEAIKQDRPTNANEDLIISALAQIYTESKVQLKKVPKQIIEQEHAEHKKEYRQIIEHQAKNN